MSATDSPITSQSWPDEEQQDYNYNSSKNYALSGRIMLASVLILFIVVFFLVLLHLYARWYLLRLRHRNDTARRRNRRHQSTHIVFYVDGNREPTPPTGGLDASVLKSLPLFVYSPESDGSDSMPECAVCLSEFEEGEKGRILPKCKHVFHTDCIDMWFYSNSTCPLCRSPVEKAVVETEHDEEPGLSLTTPPCSPVEHGGEVSVSVSETARKRIDVRIEVPARTNYENELQVSSPSLQDFRSPGSRLLALRRMINMSRRSPVMSTSPASGVGPSCVGVNTELDVESAGEESDRRGTVRGR